MRFRFRRTPFAPGLALLLGVVLVAGAGWRAASRADGFHSVLMGYKHVYDYWKENKDKLGFGETEGSYEDDAAERAAAMLKRMNQIQNELGGALTVTERQKLMDELAKLNQEYAKVAPAYGFAGTREQRRKTFMNELVKGMEFINSYNVRPQEFPAFSRDYNGELNGIAKIFLEIGEPAAEYVWEAVRNEVRFNGVQGFKEKKELEQKRMGLQRKIQDLSRALAATRDPVRHAKITEEIQALGKELSDVNLNLGNNDPNDMWNGRPMHRNQDFVKRMEEVLVGLAEKAAPVLAADLGHANANVVKEAAELLRRIGVPAVPVLVLQLGIQGREKNAAEVLTRISGRTFGTDAERWKEFFRSKGMRFPGDPAPGAKEPPPPPPTPQGPQGPPDELVRGNPPVPPAQERPQEPPQAAEAADDPPPKSGGEAPPSSEETRKALMKKLFKTGDGQPAAGADTPPAQPPKQPTKAPGELVVEEDDANKIPPDPAAWSGRDLEIAPRDPAPGAAK